MSFQGPDMSDTIEIPPRSGTAFVVKKGEAFTVIDPQGTQVSDMVAYAQGDVREVMSNGRTFDYEETIHLTTGNRLWSNRSNVMLEIEEDSLGQHDYLLTPCSEDTFRHFYPDKPVHRGCFGNLAEALALSHDFGHTPFGHTGEDVLHELMRDHGGFDHNAQSLRIVTLLERQYASFDGLNLTWETLEGVVKHNGPISPPVPAAIGVKLANPNQQVVAIVGDGAFAMSCMEIVTAKSLGLGIIYFVFKDGELAQIAQAQELPYNRKTCTVLGDVDLAGVAKAVGARFLALEQDNQIDTVIAKAIKLADGGVPVVVDVNIDYSKSTRFTRGIMKTNRKRLDMGTKTRVIGRALTRKLVR